MSDSELRALWRALDVPGDGSDFTFATIVVPGAPALHLGRSRSGPALLIASDDVESPRAPIELKNLSVRFNARCRLRQDGASSVGLFTVVRCSSADFALQDLFLDAAEAFVVAPQRDGSGSVADVIDQLVELFRSLTNAPLTSILGLWGELFLVVNSGDPDLLLSAWHGMPNDRYDFAMADERIEVKTAVGRRIHNFALEQLSPPEGTVLWVASVVTESSSAGASIYDLILQIAARSGDPIAAGRVMAKATQALGVETRQWRTARYDMARARETLRFFPHVVVPCPSSASDKVWDVRFKVDLEDIELPDVGRSGPLRLAVESPT